MQALQDRRYDADDHLIVVVAVVDVEAIELALELVLELELALLLLCDDDESCYQEWDDVNFDVHLKLNLFPLTSKMLNLCLMLCFDFGYYFEIVVAAVVIVVVVVVAVVGDDYEKRMYRVLMRTMMRCVVRECRLHSSGDYCLLFVVSIGLEEAFVILKLKVLFLALK